MNYLDSVQRSIDFIELNLKNRISVTEISDSVYISYYHFARIFKAVAGLSINEYLKRRRLSEAARELKDTEKKIVDIALDYDFDSQESFSRNFKKYFDISPAKYRKSNLNKEYKKIDISVQLMFKNRKGVVVVENRLVVKDEIKLIGIEKSIDKKRTHIDIPEMWHDYKKRVDEIENRKDNYVFYEISSADSDDCFDNFVGVEIENFENIPQGMMKKTVPANRYIVFTHKGKLVENGKSKMHGTYEYIYAKFFPESDYELGDNYSFAYCDFRKFKGNQDENSELDIYVPIK